MEIKLKDTERIDDIQLKGLKINTRILDFVWSRCSTFSKLCNSKKR